MNTLISNIVNSAEADILLNYLDQLLKIIHSKDSDVKSFILNQTPFHQAEALITILTPELESRDTQGLETKILAIRNQIKDMRIVEITTAYKPTRDEQLRHKQLISQLIEKEVLVEFTTDPSIVGGAVISGNGRIGQYTLKDFFDSRF